MSSDHPYLKKVQLLEVWRHLPLGLRWSPKLPERDTLGWRQSLQWVPRLFRYLDKPDTCLNIIRFLGPQTTHIWHPEMSEVLPKFYYSPLSHVILSTVIRRSCKLAWWSDTHQLVRFVDHSRSTPLPEWSHNVDSQVSLWAKADGCVPKQQGGRFECRQWINPRNHVLTGGFWKYPSDYFVGPHEYMVVLDIKIDSSPKMDTPSEVLLETARHSYNSTKELHPHSTQSSYTSTLDTVPGSVRTSYSSLPESFAMVSSFSRTSTIFVPDSEASSPLSSREPSPKSSKRWKDNEEKTIKFESTAQLTTKF